MHADAQLLATIAGGITAAFIGGYLARRLRLPPIVGYLVAGMAVGPFTPGFIADHACRLATPGRGTGRTETKTTTIDPSPSPSRPVRAAVAFAPPAKRPKDPCDQPGFVDRGGLRGRPTRGSEGGPMTLVRPYVRPGFAMSRFINPIMVRLGITPVLMVRGRRSGALLAVPMGPPLELDGVRYLVSGRGETHWARNLRVAGEATLRVGGKSEHFRAVELTGDERARVIAAYRRKLGGRVRGYFTKIPDAADHPVFRIDPIA